MFPVSNGLKTSAVHEKLAEVAFCVTFLLQFSVEILTNQFAIFGMLMAVELHQKRDLLLN